MSSQITAPQLLDQVAGRVDSAEVYEARTVQLPVVHRGGALESARLIETAGRALRVLVDGRLGFAATTDLSDESTLVRDALEAARSGDPVSLRFPGRQAVTAVPVFDPAVERLDVKELITLAERFAAGVNRGFSQIDVQVEARRSIEEITLLNTTGLAVQERRTAIRLSCMAAQVGEGDVLIVFNGTGARRLEDLRQAEVADYVRTRLSWAQRPAQVKTGAMPVAFSPQGSMVLVLPLALGLHGRHVHLGASPLHGKLGAQAFDAQLTLVDDGRLPDALGSASSDDEGVPTSRKALIERGRLQGFIYDLRSAAEAGAAPTGNGFKTDLMGGGGFRQAPGASYSNVLIAPGKQSLEEILRGLDEALLVDGVIGIGQGNAMGGEFSNNVALGFLVRKGEVVGRVKNTMIAGNVYELLRDRLIALGDRPQWVYGRLHMPAIVVDGVGVASKG
jgi:PmbA protein